MDQKVEGRVIGGNEQTTGASEARPLNVERNRVRARRFFRRSTENGVA